MTSFFKDNRKKWDHFTTTLPKMEALEVAIGIHEGDMTKGQVGKPARSLALVAISNELGTRNIPARPFVSTAADENRIKWWERFDRGAEKSLTGGGNPNLAFEWAGQLATRDIQKKIASITTPPNSPRTIAIKGSDKPLQDTGQLRQSIRHVVRNAK